jgi:hypothetical protein
MASTLTTDFSTDPSNTRFSGPAAHRQPKGGMFARLLQRFIDARQKQVDRELARLNSIYGSLR